MIRALWIYGSAMVLSVLDTKLKPWGRRTWKRLKKSERLSGINWEKVNERYGKVRVFEIDKGEYARLCPNGMVRGMSEQGIIVVCADLIKHANAKIF